MLQLTLNIQKNTMLYRTRLIQEGTTYKSIQVPIGLVAFNVITILHSIKEACSHIDMLTEYLNTITELDISQTNLTDKDIENLSLALEQNTTLETLDLGENNISHSIAYIAKALTINHTLKCLVLWGNKINKIDIQYLCNALQINRGLTRLNLGRNPIEDAGLESLVQSIRSIRHRSVERDLFNLNQNSCERSQEAINQLLQEAFDFHAQQMNKKFNPRKNFKIKDFLLWSYSKYRFSTTSLTALGVGVFIAHHYLKRNR